MTGVPVEMIEQALRTFCDSQYRWLIVISLTLLLGCALLLPLVDVYFREQTEKEALSLELNEATQVSSDLDRMEALVAAKAAELEELESRTVIDNSTSELRKRLQTMARESGCQVRKLQFGNVISRPWLKDDNPLSQKIGKKAAQAKTPFTLQRWPVSITLDGSMSNLKGMLDQFEKDDMLVPTKNLELYPGRTRTNVMLDLGLWYFALVRSG